MRLRRAAHWGHGLILAIAAGATASDHHGLKGGSWDQWLPLPKGTTYSNQ